jgi:site-specific recombinase XerD
MEIEKYLHHLRHERNLSEEVCRSTKTALARFHSFLDDESIVDLAEVDTGLFRRYATMLQNVASLTAPYQLMVIYCYLVWVAKGRCDDPNTSKPHGQFDSRVFSPARRGNSIGRLGDSMCWQFKRVLSNLPGSDLPTAYIPTFDGIRSFIEVAKSQERTLPLAELSYVMASTGMRTGELSRLLVTDVVSDMNLVRIESKGILAYRYIPMSARAIQSLKSLHSRFPGSKMVFGDRSRSYVSGLCHRFQSLAVKSGFEQMRVHSLRLAAIAYLHTLAQTAQEQCAVQYLAGWRDPMSSNESELDIDTILLAATRLLTSLWAKLGRDIA